jgi:hypothetical protein
MLSALDYRLVRTLCILALSLATSIVMAGCGDTSNSANEVDVATMDEAQIQSITDDWPARIKAWDSGAAEYVKSAGRCRDSMIKNVEDLQTDKVEADPSVLAPYLECVQEAAKPVRAAAPEYLEGLSLIITTVERYSQGCADAWKQVRDSGLGVLQLIDDAQSSLERRDVVRTLTLWVEDLRPALAQYLAATNATASPCQELEDVTK